MSHVQILPILLSSCLVTANGINLSPEFIEWKMESEDGSQKVPIVTWTSSLDYFEVGLLSNIYCLPQQIEKDQVLVSNIWVRMVSETDTIRIPEQNV